MPSEFVTLNVADVPFAAGRGVIYPTIKRTVVTGNKRPVCVTHDWQLWRSLIDIFTAIRS
jgi:hypothetical protein